MNRRELLKLTGMAGAAVALPSLSSFKATPDLNNATSNSGHIEVKLGDLEILIITDGYITLDAPQPVFAPGIAKSEVKRELNNLYLPEEKLEAAINVMIIKKDSKIILVDTGSGFHFGVNGGWLSENLLRAGIQTAQVTDILITHAHIDHIGGIIGKDNKPIYQNAAYYIAKKEYDFWMGNTPDFSKSKNLDNPSESVLFAQKTLGAITGRLNLFNYGEDLFSCLKTELAEGHTPGHTIFTLYSGNKTIKHVVDTFHTQLLIARPAWGTQWDVDFEKGVKTRIQILEKAFKNKELLLTTHLPWPGLGYINKKETGFEWRPLAYFTPKFITL